MSNSESSMGAKFLLRQNNDFRDGKQYAENSQNGWIAVIIANTVPGVITNFVNKVA